MACTTRCTGFPLTKFLSSGIRSIPLQTSLPRQQVRHMRSYRERTVRAMYWRARSFDAVKYPERSRDEFLDWNYRSEIFAFSRRIQENLGEDTLRKIFTHSSYLESLKKSRKSVDLPSIEIETNQSLIHRGEQLMDECIKPYLRYTFDRVPEEGIIEINSYLKSEEVLEDIAKWLGCKDIILTAERPPSSQTMASTIPALLTGIESDLGFERVRRFVIDMIISYLNDKDILDDVWIIPHPKEMLNRILSISQLPLYEPRIIFQTGIKTLESCYVIGVYSNQQFLGSSAGETIQIAEECAALNALRRMFDLTASRAPYIYGEASEKIDFSTYTVENDGLDTWKFSLN